MSSNIDYTQKFNAFVNKTLYEKLNGEQQEFIRRLAYQYKFTFQEIRQVIEASRDLTMWGESGLKDWWLEQNIQGLSENKQLKKILLSHLQGHLNRLKKSAKSYPIDRFFLPNKSQKNKNIIQKSKKQIYGICPVASDKTICCQLHTIDAVENCVFGCSYCTIQTFYSGNIAIDDNLEQKLKKISIDPKRFYHFGSGQSSDSLALGNRGGILDALCNFAANNPNILMEFKTKSNKIGYFSDKGIPKNVVCSWSLNTPTIIANEEHFTASLEQRISAARIVANLGIKIAFHLHPMIYYNNWHEDYTKVALRIMNSFDQNEVLFISFGTITLIRPVIQKIRELGNPTKTLQMELVPDPHGKFTYTDEIKIKMFQTVYDVFNPWHKKVFFYLCMEKEIIWNAVFGYVYKTNEEFEMEFGQSTMNKF
jgi:spore photoproduct lyase